MLIANELMQALKQETQRRQHAEEQAEQERQQQEFAQQQLADMENLLARYRDHFGNLPDS